jgi:hypothetical protein
MPLVDPCCALSRKPFYMPGLTRSITEAYADDHFARRYGKHDIAFEAMPHVIESLINKSIGDR